MALSVPGLSNVIGQTSLVQRKATPLPLASSSDDDDDDGIMAQILKSNP